MGGVRPAVQPMGGKWRNTWADGWMDEQAYCCLEKPTGQNKLLEYRMECGNDANRTNEIHFFLMFCLEFDGSHRK